MSNILFVYKFCCSKWKNGIFLIVKSKHTLQFGWLERVTFDSTRSVNFVVVRKRKKGNNVSVYKIKIGKTVERNVSFNYQFSGFKFGIRKRQKRGCRESTGEQC